MQEERGALTASAPLFVGGLAFPPESNRSEHVHERRVSRKDGELSEKMADGATFADTISMALMEQLLVLWGIGLSPR